MKRQIVASSKRSFVKASTVAQMLDAFESKLAEMQDRDIESATNVNSSNVLQLFDDDGYHNYEDTDGVYTGVPGSFVTLAELKNYWNDFYDDDPVLNEEYSRDQGQKWLNDTLKYMKEVESCDSVDASDALHTGRDENEWYIDTNGQFTGTPGDLVSKADLIDYWNENLQNDPSLEGDLDGWLSHTLEFMEPTDIYSNTEEIDEDLEPVKGEESWNEDNVFMLMGYTGGTEGPESDTFDCYGKFFAKDEGDADYQLWEAKQADPERMQFIDNAYTTPYNAYFDDESEVYPDLATLVKSAWIAPNDYDGNMYDEDLPFASTQTDGNPVEASLIVNEEEVADTIEDVECVPVNDPVNAALIIDGQEVADTVEDIECQTIMDGEEVSEPVEGSFFEDYFGKEQADKYGDLIASNLSGKTVSKRQDLAEEPGGLIYEAEMLGIDMWDLLEALEGMCYQGRAMEIDDSTYKVK